MPYNDRFLHVLRAVDGMEAPINEYQSIINSLKDDPETAERIKMEEAAAVALMQQYSANQARKAGLHGARSKDENGELASWLRSQQRHKVFPAMELAEQFSAKEELFERAYADPGYREALLREFFARVHLGTADVTLTIVVGMTLCQGVSTASDKDVVKGVHRLVDIWLREPVALQVQRYNFLKASEMAEATRIPQLGNIAMLPVPLFPNSEMSAARNAGMLAEVGRMYGGGGGGDDVRKSFAPLRDASEELLKNFAALTQWGGGGIGDAQPQKTRTRNGPTSYDEVLEIVSAWPAQHRRNLRGELDRQLNKGGAAAATTTRRNNNNGNNSSNNNNRGVVRGGGSAEGGEAIFGGSVPKN